MDLTTRDGQTITFEPLGYNAICALEETLGLSFGEIMTAIGANGIERWNLRVTRQVLKACAPSAVTLEAIGNLIDDVGFDRMGEVINGLIVPAQRRG